MPEISKIKGRHFVPEDLEGQEVKYIQADILLLATIFLHTNPSIGNENTGWNFVTFLVLELLKCSN